MRSTLAMSVVVRLHRSALQTISPSVCGAGDGVGPGAGGPASGVFSVDTRVDNFVIFEAVSTKAKASVDGEG